MNIIIRNETVKPMINLLESLNDSIDNQKIQILDEILNHKDYQMEFERYKGAVTKADFKNFLLNFNKLEEKDIKNVHLKIRFNQFKHFFNHINDYKTHLSIIDIPDRVIKKQSQIAIKGLPKNISIKEVHIVFTIGVGASFGYVFHNNTHFDFLQLVNEKSQEEFYATLAHEVHHVGLSQIIESKEIDQIPLDQLFFLYFAGEGLAVKYCNNAEGFFSKSIYPGEKNIGLDNKSWSYLNTHFEDIYAHFINTLRLIYKQEYSIDKLQKDIDKYWMSPYIQIEKKEKVDLKQTRLYSIGNDIWGIIHDVFGKEKVYYTLEHLDSFVNTYNQALSISGFDNYMITENE